MSTSKAGLAHRSLKADLDSMNPAAANAKLGSVVQELITAYNDLATKHNALLAKLDADAGITDTNYAALVSAVQTDIADIDERV